MSDNLAVFLRSAKVGRDSGYASGRAKAARHIATILLDFQPMLATLDPDIRAGMAECVACGGNPEIIKQLEDAT